MRERLSIFFIVVLLVLPSVVWASTPLNGTTTNTSIPPNTTAPTDTPVPTTAPPTETPTPTSVETEDALKVLDFWVSNDVVLFVEGRIKRPLGIFAAFSKKVKYTVEVRSLIEQESTTLIVAEGDNVAITWEGHLQVPVGKLIGEDTSQQVYWEPAAPGIYEIRLYGEDEVGNEIVESLKIEVIYSDETSFLGSPTPPPTIEPEAIFYIEYVEVYPDAFTPNGDGVSDVLIISAQASAELEWTVYVKEDYGGRNLRKLWGDGKIITIEWDGLGDNGERLSDYYSVSDIQTEVDSHNGIITLFVIDEHPETLSREEFERCIKEAMRDSSISQEEAKKFCTHDDNLIETRRNEDTIETTIPQMTPTPPPIIKFTSDSNSEDQSFVDCFGELSEEPSLSLNEVESICEAISSPLPEYCANLEEKLINLVSEFVDAPKEEQEKLRRSIEDVESDMHDCSRSPEAQLTTAVESPVMDPCSEVLELKNILEDVEKERVALRKLISTGEVGEEVLNDLDRKIEYLSGRLEKISVNCKQGEEIVMGVDDSPCSKLASLTSIYKELEKVKASSEGDEYVDVSAKLDRIAQEMSSLKEKCQKADLSSEGVVSFGEMETVYVTKLTALIESASNEELFESLQAIEEEKKRLIEEFTQNLGEIELKKTIIIKKFTIDGGQVSLDNVNVIIPTVKIDVEGVEVELKPSGGKVEIVEGGISVSSYSKFEYYNSTLTALKSGGSIKVLPSELKGIVSGEIGDVELVDEEAPKYIVKTSENGKLLGVIPVKMSKESQVNAEDGTIIKETSPWWGFLVLG